MDGLRFLERIEDPAQWREFSKSPQALQLRKGRGGLASWSLASDCRARFAHALFGVGHEFEDVIFWDGRGSTVTTSSEAGPRLMRPKSVVVSGRTVPDYASVMTGGGAGQSGAAAVQGGGVVLKSLS